MFKVGSVRMSPASVSATEAAPGDVGVDSGSVGTSWSVGDQLPGLPSLTVVSVGTSASTPVNVGLGIGIPAGLRGFGGISVRNASGSGMAVSPPKSRNANFPPPVGNGLERAVNIVRARLDLLVVQHVDHVLQHHAPDLHALVYVGLLL